MTELKQENVLQGQYIQVNGLNIYYEEAGCGIPLILLHGGTMNGRSWQPAIPSLAQHYRVIVPDSRGQGLTDNPGHRLSYPLMADDVAALIQALNLDHPLIFGFSDGGVVSLYLAMHYPQLCRAFVLCAVNCDFQEGYFNILAYLGIYPPGVVDFDVMTANVPDLIAYLKDHHHPEDPGYWKVLAQEYAEMWTTPFGFSDEDYKKVVDPILLVDGDRDEWVHLEKETLKLYRCIPGSELAILPSAGHMETFHKVIEDPPHLAIILDFLQRNSA